MTEHSFLVKLTLKKNSEAGSHRYVQCRLSQCDFRQKKDQASQTDFALKNILSFDAP